MGEQVAAGSSIERTREGIFGGLAQLGEHLPCKQGVESSNLSVSTGRGGGRRTHLENRIPKETRETRDIRKLRRIGGGRGGEAIRKKKEEEKRSGAPRWARRGG